MIEQNKYPLTQSFVNDIRSIINTARSNAVRSVDVCRVQMYWNLDKRIFEDEQGGKERADYGTYLIKNLAGEIEPEYGSGFSVLQLERGRHYRLYRIVSTLRTQLNWSQYQLYLSSSEQIIEQINEVKTLANNQRNEEDDK